MKIIASGDGPACPEFMSRLKEEYGPADLFLQPGAWSRQMPGWSFPAAGSILELAGHRVLVASGKGGLQDLARQAAALHCDVLLRAGRYVAWCVELEGVLVVDPGSVLHSGNSMPCSIARIDLEPGRPAACTIQWLKGVADS